MSEVAAEVLPGRAMAVLSGPMFADEVARGLPAAATIAAADERSAAFIAKSLRTRNLKLYTSDDVLGAQLGGAVKNVLAIASGITAGLELGENSRAALITRGLAEMARLGLAKGARAETLMGLSGAGDLMLTCFSAKSRNTSLGMELARGRTLDEVLGERRSVSEGVFTAEALVSLSRRLGIDMPITAAVHRILSGKHTPGEAMEDLLARPLRREWT
jgi:glycerol-3-phosphate dehydrogenase (NAD(P)+)